MKKFIAVILILAAILTLSACTTASRAESPLAILTEPVIPESSTGELPAPEMTAPETTAPETNPAVPAENLLGSDPENYFVNETNFAPDIDNVSVKPYYVRYEDGILVADCFVINGKTTAVYNISVNSLRFSDYNEALIASGSFGLLNGLVLGPGQYAVWTFHFDDDGTVNPNADLSYLSCDANTSYSF